MATGDKLVKLDGLKAVYDSLSGEIGDINDTLKNGYVSSEFEVGIWINMATKRADSNRITVKSLVHLYAGDWIAITNGDYQHAIKAWNPDSSMIRNDTTYSATGETYAATRECYVAVNFRLSDDSDVTLAGFNGTVKTYATVLAELNNKQDKNIETNVNVSGSDLVVGIALADGTYTSSTDSRHLTRSCEDLSAIKVTTGFWSTTYKAILFYNSSDEVISTVDTIGGVTNYGTIPIPNNAVKYAVNMAATHTAYLSVAEVITVEDKLALLETAYAEIPGLISSTDKYCLTTADLLVVPGGINSSGDETDLNTRIRTGIIKYDSYPVTVTAADGYEFAIATYNTDYSFANFINWNTSYTCNSTNFRIVVRKTSGLTIAPSEFSSAIASGLENAYCVIPLGTVRDKVITNTANINALTNQFNLNDHMVSLQDMCWEYQNWVFPQVLSYTGIRDQLYFTFTTGTGYSGIAQYNYTTHEVTKTILKRNGEADDHNLIAVMFLPDHRLLCAYSGGHNTDKCLYIRRSKKPESIDWFEDVITLTCTKNTSYAQMFYYDSKVYLFYRAGNTGWNYRISSDDGETWSDESALITSSIQYYIQLTETTTDGVLRLCCYSNPAESETDIRTALLHLDNMSIYNADDATVISAAPFVYTDVPVLIAQPGDGVVNRLYNALQTSKDDIKILFAQFPINGSATATYYVYDNGTITEIVNAGTSYWPPKVQNGIAWVGSDKIVLARGYQGSDLIELYNYSNGTVTLNTTIASNPRGTLGLRTMKPMVDNNARSIIYVTGYFNPQSFKDFNMDAVVYNLSNE